MDILYRKWLSIRQKCYNPKNDNFIYYGGKGVVICEEWEDYNKFRKWALENGYKDGLVLSRKDPDGDFEPSNCEWISDIEHRAKRGKTGKVEYVEYNNRKVTLSELSKITGINFNTIRSRYLSGKRGKALIVKPNRKATCIA